jgi:hypothetical protein
LLRAITFGVAVVALVFAAAADRDSPRGCADTGRDSSSVVHGTDQPADCTPAR